jgi:predicted SAM-dependent methyltransferase
MRRAAWRKKDPHGRIDPVISQIYLFGIIMTRRLHIGGKRKHEGWEVVNINPAPHVDHLRDASDLSIFPDNAITEIYASHVVEHFDCVDVLFSTLREWLRVLKPGGKIFISVPNMDVLATLYSFEKNKYTAAVSGNANDLRRTYRQT